MSISGMIVGMISRKLIPLLLLASFAAAQQVPNTAPKTEPKAEKSEPKTILLDLQPTKEPEFDTQAVVKETEFVDSRNHKMGIFWWVPSEFWEISLQKQGFSAENAKKAFAPFKKYNLFIVAVGDMGVGNFSWMNDADIKKRVLLRDQKGNTYTPIDEVPEEAASIVDVMKPMLKNMMGRMGEGMQFLLFPSVDSTGKVFADPHKSSEIYLDVSDVMGTASSTYTWRLPLSSLSQAKYCPVGKERVEANWKFCPWHGVKLTEDTTAINVSK
jgi:hypothetical protein